MRVSVVTRAALLVFAILFMDTIVRSQDVLIIVNSSVPISRITETQLRDIFTGVRSQFDNGTRAVPVLLKGGPVHEVFLHRHIGDTPDEFRIRWRRAIFTGQGSMPKEFNTEAALIQYIQVTPGAIGYVSRLPQNLSVKALTVKDVR